MESLLRTEALCAFYGAIQVLFDIDVAVRQGEIVALLGANGAGKTSFLRAISGMVRVTGSIRYRDAPVSDLAIARRSRLGIAHVPQGRGTFLEQSVADNLRIGAMIRRDKAGIQADLEEIYAWFPGLKKKRAEIAGRLSGGEQQMLAIGRALMLRPQLLLLDEPSLGLAPMMIEQVFSTLYNINQDRGLTIIIAEQNTGSFCDVAAKAYVLETGHVAFRGDIHALSREDGTRSVSSGRGER
jgi:branched-chain amino acid transport system ATP-binding protein